MSSPVFLVTGASSGLGRAVAKEAITKFNARVAVIARRVTMLESLRDELSKDKQDHILIVAGSVTDESVIQNAVEQAVAKWGHLDAIVANAGVLEPVARLEHSPLQAWRDLFEINLFSVVRLVQIALPHLRTSKGTILLVSSGASSKPYKAWGAYGASKAALNHLAATLAAEESDVTTIALRPGVLDTELQEQVRQLGKDVMQDDYEKFDGLHSAGKLVKPEEPGHVIASLCARPSKKELSGKFLSWDDELLRDNRCDGAVSF